MAEEKKNAPEMTQQDLSEQSRIRLEKLQGLVAEGKDPYERKLRGITDMTALLGKKEFERILGPLVYKPSGKPVLVRESDKRPEYNTATTDFKE